MNKPTLGLATLLMLGGATVAHAQDGPGDRMQGPAQGLERGPGSDMPSGDGPGGGEGPRGGGPGGAELDSPDGDAGGIGPRAEGPNPDVRKGAPEGDPSGAVREDGPRAGDNPPDAAERQRKSAGDTKGSDRKSRAEAKEKTRGKSADDPTSKRNSQAKSDDDGGGDAKRASRKDAAEADKAKPSDAGKQAEAAKQADDARKPPEEVKKANLSGDKRERVGAAFRGSRDVTRRTDVDIDISIGTRLPRDWAFAPVPVAVVEVVPAYRGYVFAYVEDEYVICDPVTYEVVAVVPVSGGGPRYAAGGGPDRCSTSMTLNDDERAYILRSIQITDEVDVSDITVGWSVPGDIELRTFPEPVVSRSGKLAACRYFLADDQIAIVDPAEETVVLLIDQD